MRNEVYIVYLYCQTKQRLTMKEFNRNNYNGTPLSVLNRMFRGSKCTNNIECQLATFVNCASYAVTTEDSGSDLRHTYIDMHSDPLKINGHHYPFEILGMVSFSISEEKQYRMVVNGKALPNPQTIITFTPHLAFLVKTISGIDGGEQYMNPHMLLKTCKEWTEFRRAFARSSWNRK